MTRTCRSDVAIQMNYYPFHVGDYAAHTGHLEPMEDLAYRRLLDLYYMREAPLPADIQTTAKLVRMRSCAADVESVLREFFTLADEGWRHSRCDEEIEKMQSKQAKARASAAASVNARRAKAEQQTNASSTDAERSLPNDEANAERSLLKTSTEVELPTPTPTPNTAKAVGASRRKPQTALPEDFAPNDVGMNRAAEKHLDVPTELEKFRNHHAAKGSVMADWQAAWRTWVGNARPGVARSQQRPHDREAADRADPRPQWALDAGFANVYEARNDGCNERTAHLFRDGKRIEVAA